MTTEEIKPEFDVLAAVMQQMLNDSHSMSGTLIDSYKHSYEQERDTLKVVRYLVSELISGDFMPTSAAIMRALYPSEKTIEKVKDYADDLF